MGKRYSSNRINDGVLDVDQQGKNGLQGEQGLQGKNWVDVVRGNSKSDSVEEFGRKRIVRLFLTRNIDNRL
ncbi:hypothetical protein MKX01_026238, partial [Papaver californicum]